MTAPNAAKRCIIAFVIHQHLADHLHLVTDFQNTGILNQITLTDSEMNNQSSEEPREQPMDNSMHEPSFASLTLEEKRNKIKANYETIEVLRARLEETQRRERVGMTRAAYIKMIFDATKKVDRQNGELSKAVLETRQLQRDIRSLCGRLDRSFKLVEETILRDAGGDIWAQDCYKLLRVMRESCDQLIQFVQETSVLTRELRELEDQIGHAKLRHSISTT